MTEINKEQYIANVRVMNYLLQEIPDDIYNSIDASKTAQEMWERIKRLMYGSNVTNHVRHSRLMDEFDKFVAKEGESLESVYERLTTLVNIMDRNNVRPIPVSINTKFLNCLQPVWSKYVTIVRHNQTGDTVSYDQLYDSLVQFKPHVQASKAKRASRNHDLLALFAHSNASLLTQKDESNQIIQRVLRTESNPRKANVQCYNCSSKGHFARDCPKPKVDDAKYFKEQMLICMKDEAGGNLNDEENHFMLDNAYGDDTLEDLTVVVIMMARIEPTDDKAEIEQKYDSKVVSELSFGKNPSRSFRPMKTTKIFWLIWASRSLGVPLALDRSWSKWEPSAFAIGECHLPIESIIASRSTDVMVEPQ
ncbi:integrase, catalytic region, zinc finger, CCHC-type containing protein [Tanacetum coccineum]